ncbi:hypothetical protein BDF22DRAFT_741529 [Syncephalis plumigaleata]|nr:hypothetical protein BDF22DRAFT_741529 [Syncephalis plumigaleata]
MSASIDYSYNTSHRWFRLPTEIRQQILLQLNTIDLIRLLHVCKGIYNVIKIDCLVWRHLFRRSFPACDAEEDWMTWRFANDLSSTMPYTGHSYDVATGTRGRFHNNNNNNSNNTWRPSSYNKHSHIDWWQLFWERVQLERNWRRGCFDIDSISLPTNDVTSSSNGSTFGLDVLATRAWGTLFGQCMTNAWIVVHVAGQPISPMSRLEMPIPTGEPASSTIRIVSAIMTTQGSILIHGRLSSTIASDDEATQITSTLFDTDHLWLYRLNSTTLSYCRT